MLRGGAGGGAKGSSAGKGGGGGRPPAIEKAAQKAYEAYKAQEVNAYKEIERLRKLMTEGKISPAEFAKRAESLLKAVIDAVKNWESKYGNSQSKSTHTNKIEATNKAIKYNKNRANDFQKVLDKRASQKNSMIGKLCSLIRKVPNIHKAVKVAKKGCPTDRRKQ